MALSLQRYTWSFYMDRRDSSSNQSNQYQLVSATMEAASEDGYKCLSQDLITEILSRLPVADLSRYKCVCKSWYSLISSSHFISKHLQNYYQNLNDPTCLLALYYILPSELNLFELSIDETTPNTVLASESLDNRPMYGSFICGPCHGIYYLYDYNYGGQRALWNPVTNDLKPLPPLIITKPNLPCNLAYSVCEHYGFGFDPLTKHYKVAVIKCYCSEDYETVITLPAASIFVYSLHTDSWTYCGDLSQIYDFGLHSNKCYTFLDGSYYWLLSSGANDENDCVISFDMSTDAYQQIHTPIYEMPASRSLALYHKSVAYLTLHEIKKDFVIWMLNEGLWTKKFTIGPLSGIRSPVGHWKDDKLLLNSDDGRLILCDPVTQETRDLGYHAGLQCEATFVYRESLVSLKDCTQSRQWHDEAESENNQP